MATTTAVLTAAMQELTNNPRATMAEIAAAAGISRTSLHRMYANRDALLIAIAEIGIAHVLEIIDASGIDDLPARDALPRLVTGLLPLGRQFWYLQHSGADFEHAPELAEAATAVPARFFRFLARAQEEGVLRADQSPVWLGCQLEGVLHAAANALHRGDLAPNDAAALALSAFLDGARARPGAETSRFAARPVKPEIPV